MRRFHRHLTNLNYFSLLSNGSVMRQLMRYGDLLLDLTTRIALFPIRAAYGVPPKTFDGAERMAQTNLNCRLERVANHHR